MFFTLVADFLRQLNARFNRDVNGVAPEAIDALMAENFPVTGGPCPQGLRADVLNLPRREFAYSPPLPS